jgi:hypothetical protein
MSIGATPSPAAAVADPIRAALNDIVAWSVDGPAWQRDGLRRLYAQQKLSVTDVDELYVLCRQVHDLLDTGESPLTAQPLHASHVPANWNTGGVVALKSIGHAKNVNALADDQTLNFAEIGLTIVYGDNGAGKSGYGRVLKRACRARDQEEILTNQYSQPSGKPTAQIKYSVAGTVQPEVAWQDGVAARRFEPPVTVAPFVRDAILAPIVFQRREHEITGLRAFFNRVHADGMGAIRRAIAGTDDVIIILPALAAESDGHEQAARPGERLPLK